MNAIKAAQSAADYSPRRHGWKLLGNVCCGNGKLECAEGFLIYDCKDHLFVIYKDGEMLATVTRGTRQ